MVKLHITIMSFSFRNGIPEDSSGNGGGFVFDCRALANPGRLPEYQTLTGKDASVIEYLKKNSEADSFVENSCQMVGQSIQAYLKAEYTHLMVCFGCTGGQHRSVYCAELLAHKIRKIPDVDVSLCHREQSHL